MAPNIIFLERKYPISASSLNNDRIRGTIQISHAPTGHCKFLCPARSDELMDNQNPSQCSGVAPAGTSCRGRAVTCDCAAACSRASEAPSRPESGPRSGALSRPAPRLININDAEAPPPPPRAPRAHATVCILWLRVRCVIEV
ncbi:hypothetical protein EVAR_33928_1 [Eumeta japonica]|uniref:Uncharacterized protein n=1 Tax=Eumeta variegata TaxID=151549 RepID=A0A4C1VXR4_EUMVA|nr:hypothetical protein EVAR_33928_1 [Eumeta japonica]